MTKAISKKNSLSHKKFHFVKGRIEQNFSLNYQSKEAKSSIFLLLEFCIFLLKDEMLRERMFVQFLTYITSTMST